MDEEKELEYLAIENEFEAVFFAPDSLEQFKTKKAAEFWSLREEYIYTLMGPISSCFNGGRFENIFNDTNYWKGVDSYDDLMAWYKMKAFEWRSKIQKFEAYNEPESQDLKRMNFIIDEMEATALKVVRWVMS